MRILIVTALFPPDVAAPAPYVKELATRLGSDHDVTVLTYGTIPEAIAGVEIIAVSKKQSPWPRLWSFFTALRRAAQINEVVIVNNAPSTELPAWFASFRSNAEWLLLMSDEKIEYRGWRKWLHGKAAARLHRAAVPLPLPRPEQHPFHPPSETEWKLYELSWEEHVASLNEQFI